MEETNLMKEEIKKFEEVLKQKNTRIIELEEELKKKDRILGLYTKAIEEVKKNG